MGHKHGRAGKEGPAETLFPKGSEKAQHPSKAAGVLPSLINPEHTDILPLCLVCQLHSGATESAAEGH